MAGCDANVARRAARPDTPNSYARRALPVAAFGQVAEGEIDVRLSGVLKSLGQLNEDAPYLLVIKLRGLWSDIQICWLRVRQRDEDFCLPVLRGGVGVTDPRPIARRRRTVRYLIRPPATKDG